MEEVFALVLVMFCIILLLHDLSNKTNKILIFKVHSFLIKKMNFLVVSFENPEIFSSLIDNNKKVLFKHQRYSLMKSDVIIFNDFAYNEKYQIDLHTLSKYYKTIFIRYNINNYQHGIIAEYDKKSKKLVYRKNFEVFDFKSKVLNVKKVYCLVVNNIDINIFEHLNIKEIIYIKKIWFFPKRTIKKVVFKHFEKSSNFQYKKFDEISFINCKFIDLTVCKAINLYHCVIENLNAVCVNMYDCRVADFSKVENYLYYEYKHTNFYIGQLVLIDKKLVRVLGYNYFNEYRKYSYIGQDLKNKTYYFNIEDINKKLYFKSSDVVNDLSIFLDIEYKWSDYKNYKSFKQQNIKMEIKNKVSDLIGLVCYDKEDLNFLLIKLYFERLKFSYPESNLLNILVLDCTYFVEKNEIIKMKKIESYRQIINRIKFIIKE